MSARGEPHIVVLKPRDVDAQAIGVHVHERHEELIVLLEEKERRVAIRAEPTAVFFAKLDDLVLREAQLVEIQVQRTEHRSKLGIFHHFVDGDFRLFRGFAALVEAPTLETTVDEHTEHAFFLGNIAGTVTSTDGNRFTLEQTPEDRILFLIGKIDFAEILEEFEEFRGKTNRLVDAFLQNRLFHFVPRNILQTRLKFKKLLQTNHDTLHPHGGETSDSTPCRTKSEPIRRKEYIMK